MTEHKNDMSEIGRMVEELERYCDIEQLPMKTGLDLNLVLEELVTNSISYGWTKMNTLSRFISSLMETPLSKSC